MLDVVTDDVGDETRVQVFLAVNLAAVQTDGKILLPIITAGGSLKIRLRTGRRKSERSPIVSAEVRVNGYRTCTKNIERELGPLRTRPPKRG